MADQTRKADWPIAFLRTIEAEDAEDGMFVTCAQAATLRAEIQRLRGRLAKIENAPIDPNNVAAMILKRWAAPRDGEPANAR